MEFNHQYFLWITLDIDLQKSKVCTGWVFIPGHILIITSTLLYISYVICRLLTNRIDSTIKMEVQCVWDTEKTCVRRTAVGQWTNPRYYLVKYSHIGLEQVRNIPHIQSDWNLVREESNWIFDGKSNLLILITSFTPTIVFYSYQLYHDHDMERTELCKVTMWHGD